MGQVWKIEQDFNAENPRVCMDNLGRFVMAHGRYAFGDVNISGRNGVQARMVIDELVGPEEAGISLSDFSKRYIGTTVYMLDHSGLAVSTVDFADPWDSGPIGLIAVSREKVREEFGWKKISARREEMVMEILREEIRKLNCYLQEDTYICVLEDTASGEVLDLIAGFYGRKSAEEFVQEVGGEV